MPARYDIAVVGSGIVGMGAAYAAARRGLSVVLFDRDPAPVSASIRNFGMVWPIGQPAGPKYDLARRSREIWLRASRQFGFPLRECGSILLTHRPDEQAVLEELFASGLGDAFDAQLLSPAQVNARTPAANPDGLLGGFWSPWEAAVDPPQAVASVSHGLAETYGVQREYSAPIVSVEDDRVVASDGRAWQADRILVANGAEMRLLFPELLADAGFRLCKLQMLSTVPQPGGWNLGPHLASGLTLRHYETFAKLGSLAALKERVARETPHLDEYGIHVMASQGSDGRLILGDSHQYDGAIPPYDDARIDDWIVEELRKIVRFPDWTILRRWHGVYAKYPQGTHFFRAVSPTTYVLTGLGGNGMTLGFGLTDELIENWAAPARSGLFREREIAA